MAAQSNSFDRILSVKDHFRGKPLWAVMYAALAGAALFCFLVFAVLLLGVLEHRGRIGETAISHLQSLNTLPAETTVSATDDNGILPTTWFSRGRLPGVVAAMFYNGSEHFHDAQLAAKWLVGLMAVAGVIWILALAGSSRAARQAGQVIGDRLRLSVHRQALRLAPSDLSDKRGNEAVELFTERIGRIGQGVTSWLRVGGRDVFEVVAIILFMLLIQWSVALQCLIPLGVCWFVLRGVFRRYRRKDELARDNARGELKLLSESLQKSRLVRAYGMEDYELTQFRVHMENYHEKVGDLARGRRRQSWMTRLAVLTVTVIIAWFALAEAVLRAEGDPARLPISEAVMLMACLAYLPTPLGRLSHLFESRRRTTVDAGMIHRYISRIPEVGQAVGAKFLQPLSRVLQFDSVEYSDKHSKLLKGLDLKIAAGEVVCLISMNPAEARAVAYLLPRFIEPSSGRVLVDGEDIAWVTLESLRAETMFVGGSEPFFTGSVFQNLSCSESDYTLQQATEAAKLAHAHNFILELPQGYETQIGEHGEDLDPGQAFRLSLARGVLRKPALLVVEEPTATLNSDSKSLIDDAYGRILKGRTAIFLPTRLSTIKRADRVILIHNGRVEASGKQDQLLKSSPLYRHWEYLKFNEFREGRNK